MPQMVVNKEFEALIKDMDKQKDKSIKCGTQHSQTVRLSKNPISQQNILKKSRVINSFNSLNISIFTA